MLDELCMLEETDLELYSLQLEMYKQIIERNVPIKLGKSYLVWFSHNNESYKVIECKDMTYYIKMIVNKRLLEIL